VAPLVVEPAWTTATQVVEADGEVAVAVDDVDDVDDAEDEVLVGSDDPVGDELGASAPSLPVSTGCFVGLA
jgi:hypothetical protein